MNSEHEPTVTAPSVGDSRKATARLLATIGSARILRHRDGSLDVCGAVGAERNAALTWLCTVSPALVARVRHYNPSDS